MAKPHCQTCQTLFPPRAPEALCPRCLIAQLCQPERAVVSVRRPKNLPEEQQLNQELSSFTLFEQIGVGAMGLVYQAWDEKRDEVVAIKVMAPELRATPIFQARFEQETSLLKTLNHPGIVRTFAGQSNDDFSYLVMEYVSGSNLRELIRNEQLEFTEIVDLISQLCHGLQYAHDADVIHRDIKPENLLIDESGQLKIADFGLAKVCKSTAVQASLTATGQILGTPHYMAPEQFENPQSVDKQADIYSVGVLLYELLVGELPIGRFPLPSEKAGYSQRVDNLVLQALEKSPKKRFQTPMELHAALHEIVSNSLVYQPTTPAIPEEIKDEPQEASALAVLAVLLGLTGPVLVSSSLALWYRTNGFLNYPEKILLGESGMLIGLVAIILTPIIAMIATNKIQSSDNKLWGQQIATPALLAIPASFVIFQSVSLFSTLAGVGLEVQYARSLGFAVGLMAVFVPGVRIHRHLSKPNRSHFMAFILIGVLHLLCISGASYLFARADGFKEVQKVLTIQRVYRENPNQPEKMYEVPAIYDMLNGRVPNEFYIQFLEKTARDSQTFERDDLLSDIQYLKQTLPTLSSLQGELVKTIISQICYDRTISKAERTKIKKIVTHIRRNNSVILGELKAELKPSARDKPGSIKTIDSNQ